MQQISFSAGLHLQQRSDRNPWWASNVFWKANKKCLTLKRKDLENLKWGNKGFRGEETHLYLLHFFIYWLVLGWIRRTIFCREVSPKFSSIFGAGSLIAMTHRIMRVGTQDVKASFLFAAGYCSLTYTKTGMALRNENYCFLLTQIVTFHPQFGVLRLW